MTTETLTETRPLEPTTPIKPSEAIRLGCLLAPVQAFGFYEYGEGTACATGALNLGRGRAVYAEVEEDWVPFNFPCPVQGCRRVGQIPHLNDDHRWSRERIADWLEGLGL